ncbi:hypothetical protein HYDPIDRAFT_34924 [Hydnomerulius pinastri MD-312]|uniref:Unplaced genomic scaffold scaffold_378, whole genome shotgun sequence n=1 Tax=Hydnomerulius pinastri MD-312 TaxID=994086 RepID=A0A0C9W6A9_9AGAM|nr:hypothetical protein HYDPIDRAFT_34924 [Hydnomerulius pinastri MD-312]
MANHHTTNNLEIKMQERARLASNITRLQEQHRALTDEIAAETAATQHQSDARSACNQCTKANGTCTYTTSGTRAKACDRCRQQKVKCSGVGGRLSSMKRRREGTDSVRDHKRARVGDEGGADREVMSRGRVRTEETVLRDSDTHHNMQSALRQIVHSVSTWEAVIRELLRTHQDAVSRKRARCAKSQLVLSLAQSQIMQREARVGLEAGALDEMEGALVTVP